MDFIKAPGTYSLCPTVCAVSTASAWAAIQGLMNKYIFTPHIRKDEQHHQHWSSKCSHSVAFYC